MGLILVFLFGAASVVFLYRAVAPFLGSRAEQARTDYLENEVRQVEKLAARKAMLLQTLRELEFDHQTNKVSDEDYEKFRGRYERQAVAVMKQLDEIHGGRGWQDSIEQQVSQRLGEPVAQAEDPATQPPAPESPAQASFDCTSCGATLESDDRFCSKCGARVEIQPVEADRPSEATA